MGLYRILKISLIYFFVIVLFGELRSVHSSVYIHFSKTPPAWSRFSDAVFGYSVHRRDGSDACMNSGCSVHCELDGHTLRPCSAGVIAFRNLTVNHRHHFRLNVTTHNGEANSSAYSWYIDTIPPTATVSTERTYTNTAKITVDITFSEACSGQDGFKCLKSTNCDVIINGPGRANVSSLHIVKPNIKYKLDVVLSPKSSNGRLIIRLADGFCKDKAGNRFKRTKQSIIVVHYDRRPMLVDLWTSVPSYVLGINGVPRTVYATNNIDDLKIFLDFSIPVMNSTKEILSSLHVSSGNLISARDKSPGNRRFVFEIKNISITEIITVQLQPGLIVGISGSPISSRSSLTFLYDFKSPLVRLTTSSPSITKESNIHFIVEFTKPVFGFESSMVQVGGGRLTRFKELSRALYSLTVLAVTQSMVSVTVPAGRVTDVSGNPNLESNRIEVKHYLTPEISIALHSFVTAGILATSLAAATLSISSANLEAVGILSSGSTNLVASNPSMNLHGMVGHLQVFVLSDWLLTNQPIVYSETTKGLRWLIPRQELPWKKDSMSIWPNHIHLAEETFFKRFSAVFVILPSIKTDYNMLKLNLTKTVCGWLLRHQNISTKQINTLFGQPISSDEYFTYFLRGEPLSASNVVKRIENYKGWDDLKMNLFWLAIGGGSLLGIHIVILIFLRRRTGTPAHGILSVPRFELLLLILMLPCISQSAAFVIRGGTTDGIITGAILLVIPAAFILSVCLFLVIAIFSGSFAQYKEIRYAITDEKWYMKLWFSLTGRPSTGKWFYREGLPSSFLSRFSILFENRKGPPLYVFTDQNETNTIPRWTESSQVGTGRMKAISSDDSNEEIKITASRRIFGCARSSYVVLDLTRRMCLGIISGAYSSPNRNQSLFALTITLIQFIYLSTLRPHVRDGINFIESVSLLCEIGIFGVSISLDSANPDKAKRLGYLMLGFLFLTFVAQIINEWYALINCLLKFSRFQEKNSFGLGLKIATKGLVFPFYPKKHWSKVLLGSSSQSKPGLNPVNQETNVERRDHTRAPRVDSFRAMTATVFPLLSPGSPKATERENLTGQSVGESRRGKDIKLDGKRDMRKLRELARASFSGDPKTEEGSTSYAFRLQYSPETSSDNPQDTSKN